MKSMRKESSATSNVIIKVSSLCRPRNFIFAALFILAVFLSACSNPSGSDGAAYKIGDKGPAGGIVFYDRGYYHNDTYSVGSVDYTINWRYMEAAPASTEFMAEWGPQNYDVSIGNSSMLTWSDVGNGEKNTQIIVNSYSEYDLTGFAAQKCINLVVGKYNDWFLPSNQELLAMYNNLKVANLGGFSNALYWSSTQANPDSDGVFNLAYAVNFDDGSYLVGWIKDVSRLVRAVRYF